MIFAVGGGYPASNVGTARKSVIVPGLRAYIGERTMVALRPVLSPIVACVLAILLFAAEARSQVCSSCAPVPSGDSGMDFCSIWLVTWTRIDAGDCRLNPKCMPAQGCVFSVRVDIWDNCGGAYATTLCSQFLDQNGLPIGAPLCGPAIPVPPPANPPGPASPLEIVDYTVGCGRQDSLAFSRSVGGAAPVTFLTVAAGCKACATQGDGQGG